MELAGVLISTTPERYPAMRAFYVERLRLLPRSDRPLFVNFDFGRTRLSIAVHDGLDGPARDPLRVMVNLSTEDIDGAIGRCEPETVLRWPERETWGGLVATVADPDGNIIQFLQME
ncbi:MAG TPA: hypothetical protein VMS74_04905 [Acidimicrobiia bacterium]|nr:hypothetical protein [Acidimicrobiia bacterium]